MPTRAQLEQLLGKPLGGLISQLVKEAETGQLQVNDVIDLTFLPNKDMAFRAAWLLDAIITPSAEKYLDQLDKLVTLMPKVKHAGCKRHYARIMMFYTAGDAPETVKAKVRQIDMEPVIEQCFDWMINAKVKVAVKVCAAKTIFNLRDRFPWVSEELTNQLKHLMRDGTAAMQAAGRNLLDQLAPPAH